MRVDLGENQRGKQIYPICLPLFNNMALGYEEQLVYAPNLGQEMAYYTGFF